jgi:hypothetical protein
LSASQSTGPATDKFNIPVIDPTENVRELVQASNRRHDDLMAAGFQRVDDLLNAHTARLDERFRLEAEHLREMAELRAAHEETIRRIESSRLDAIRLVDTQAVIRAAEVQLAQQTALATQVATTAETQRNQVQATAVALQTQFTQALGPMQKDIADLRTSQSQQQGSKTQQQEGGNRNQWIVGLAVSIMFSVIGLGVTIAIVLLTR